MPDKQPENLLQKFVKQQTENNQIKATLKSVLQYLEIKDWQYRAMLGRCDEALPVGLVWKIEKFNEEVK